MVFRTTPALSVAKRPSFQHSDAPSLIGGPGPRALFVALLDSKTPASPAQIHRFAQWLQQDISGRWERSLYRWAREAENRGRYDLALALFQTIGDHGKVLAPKARSMAASLSGREFNIETLSILFRQTLLQVTDPISSLGMGLAMAGGKFLQWRGLASRLGRGSISQGLGPWLRIKTGIQAWAFETSVMVAADQGIRPLYNPHSSLGSLSWQQSFLHHGVAFFCLKTVPAFTSRGFYGALGWDPIQGARQQFLGAVGWMQKALPLASTFGALSLSSFILDSSSAAGLQHHSFQMLALGLQMAMMLPVSFELLGSRFHRSFEYWQWRSYQESSVFRQRVFPHEKVAASKFHPEDSAEIHPETMVKSLSDAPGANETPFFQITHLLTTRLGLEADSPQLGRLRRMLLKNGAREFYRYYDFLAQSDLPNLRFKNRRGEEQSLSAAEVLERTLEMGNHFFAVDAVHRVHGTLFEHLGQSAFLETLTSKDPRLFDRLLKVMAGEPSIKDLEDFFLLSNLSSKYGLTGKNALSVHDYRRAILSHTLPDAIRGPIAAYFARLRDFHRLPEFLKPQNNRILEQGEADLPMDAALAVRVLRYHYSQDEKRSPILSVSLIEQIVERAELSPVGMLYMDRMFKILVPGKRWEGRQHLPKLHELADPGDFDWSRLLEYLPNKRSHYSQRVAHSLQNTVFTGYLGSHSLSLYLMDFYRRVPELLEGSQASKLRHNFEREVAWQLVISRGRWTQSLVTRLLTYQPTITSHVSAQLLQKGEVDLSILPAEKMAIYWGNNSEEVPLAFLLPPSYRPTGEPARPLIVVREPSPNLRGTEAAKQALQLLRGVVHEMSHYQRDYQSGSERFFNDSLSKLRSEVFAYTEELHFALRQGEVGAWGLSDRHSYGWPGFIRTQVEHHYLP